MPSLSSTTSHFISFTDDSLMFFLIYPTRRAIEELLKETDRARVRAETMGPAGW